MTVLKELHEALTEELVASLVKKYIEVPVNKHTNPDSPEETVNAWFAGQVAGFEKAELHFDYMKNEYREEPAVFYNILLTDGMGYVLSKDACEIRELTKEAFQEMVAQHLAEEAIEQEAEAILKNQLILPEGADKEKKIILPGEFLD